MGYRVFDRRRLKLKPLEERVHDFNVSQVLSLSDETPPFEDRRIAEIARRIVDARSRGSQVIFMMGAHVIKVGLSRFVIELMKKGMVTHVAGNGAVAIHDFELSLIGATTESVAKYIRTGEFGLWKETGMINDIAREFGIEKS